MLISEVANEILKQVEILYNNEQKFTDQILMTLHPIFDDILPRALELMEIGTFTLYSTPKGLRKLLKVKGKTGEYILFYNINFCPCLAFHYQVLKQKKYITCKHVLAAKLMGISRKLTEELISNSQMSDLIKNQSKISL